MKRRGFFALAASIGAGAAAARADITAQNIDACEALLGFDLTPEEQQQAIGLLESELDGLRALQATVPANEEAPALVFDPRLPGRLLRPLPSLTNAIPQPPTMPKEDEDIAFAPLWHQSSWIRSGQLTSARLTDIYLSRMKAIAPTLECFITITEELARTQAKAADAALARGDYKGPLHGIPYGLKDLADTGGIATTWGASTEKSRVPETDSIIYQRLTKAGAVLLGKTTLGALAFGDQWFGGRTNNPWNMAEGSSGSSAGSAAAVAAGLASFAIGSETMGSIVSPSDRTGCAGLRPTFGRVARTGCMALCWSLDKLGPLTRSINDTALVLDAINGADGGDPSSIEMPFSYDLSGGDPQRPVIGYDPGWFEGNAAHAVDRDVLDALKSSNARLVELSLPDLPYGSLGPILMAEAAAAFEELTLSNRDDALMWQGDYAWPNSFRAARFYPAIALVQLDRLRRKVMEAMDDVMADVDALVHPSYAANLLQIGNFTGRPTAVIRGGYINQPTRTLFEDDVPPDPGEPTFRVPRSFSLTGHLFDEARLISIAAMLEETLNIWHQRPPV